MKHVYDNLTGSEIEYIKGKFGFEELPEELEEVVSLYNQIREDFLEDNSPIENDILLRIMREFRSALSNYIYYDSDKDEWKLEEVYKK